MKRFVLWSLLVIAGTGVNIANIVSQKDQVLFIIAYTILTVLHLYLGIKLLRWFKVILTDDKLIVRYYRNKRTVISRSEIKGVHVKDRETILLLKDDEVFTIKHIRLNNNEELITLLEKAYPAALPPANFLGKYQVAEN